MRLAFLFPGQNSQQVGMGASIAQAYPEIKSDYFDRADQVLGFELSKLCFEGPAEELVKTENQQPAIFLISCAVLQLLKPLRAQAVAG
ncbi:MAG: ACP S-malonyltransferase, partial [Chloroflexota bacterium]